MKKKLVIIFLLILFLGTIWADQTIVLSELSYPSHLKVDENQLYLADNTSVLIYSLKDFSLVKKFGQQGEGPQEFINISSLRLTTRDLLVNSRNKISIYSKDGTFREEIKVKKGSDFIRTGNQFIGMELKWVDRVSSISINLFDQELKNIKEIRCLKGLFFGGKHLNPILMYGPLGPIYQMLNNKLLVKSGQGTIEIMEPNGKVLSTISLENEKVAVTDTHKEKILDFYQTKSKMKHQFAAMKKKMKFPEYFPPIRHYSADGNHLYILTFREKNGAKEMLIYNDKGKFLKRLYVPVVESNIMVLYPYYIKDNTLYQLIEAEEDWQLKVTKIL